jgi:hypothetical protein
MESSEESMTHVRARRYRPVPLRHEHREITEDSLSGDAMVACRSPPFHTVFSDEPT